MKEVCALNEKQEKALRLRLQLAGAYNMVNLTRHIRMRCLGMSVFTIINLCKGDFGEPFTNIVTVVSWSPQTSCKT
jgi:hypothetical protein